MKLALNTRLSVPAFLILLSAGLIATPLIVAFVINRIEPPAFAPEFSLPWDPTHTALKYLVSAVLVVTGAFLWRRYQSDQSSGALLPALPLATAVPVGAVGYESISSD